MTTAQPRYQFVRIEPNNARVGRNRILEAARAPTHCSHIEHPRPPLIRFGSQAHSFGRLDAFLATPQEYQSKTGKTLTRKPRQDMRCVVDSVSSFPIPIHDLEFGPAADREMLKSWLRADIEFNKSRFEPYFVSSFFHADETYPHTHSFYIGNPTHLHPGLKAEIVDGRRVEDPKERLRRHMEALRQYQQDYYDVVSRRFGFQRCGKVRKFHVADLRSFKLVQQLQDLLAASENECATERLARIREVLGP